MSYVKLVDGNIQFPPKTLRTPTKVVFNFDQCPSALIAEGYYEVEYGTQPEVPDGKMIVPHYAQIDPVGTSHMVPVLDENGDPTYDPDGVQIYAEETQYDRQHPIIRVTYILEDMPDGEDI